MKKFILIAFLVAIAATAYAAKPGLPVDGGGIRVMGFAPDGKKDITLAVTSQTVDMRNDLAWSQYAPGACKFRSMTTATKAGLARTLPATTWNQRNVNASTPFINFSGCTSGELQRH